MIADKAAELVKQTIEDLQRRGESQRAEAIEALLVDNARLRANLLLIGQVADASAAQSSQQQPAQAEDKPPAYVPSVAARRNAKRRKELPPLDLLTSTEVGDLVGVTGQTIKNWVREGRMTGYRIGNRIMVPREIVEEYVRCARSSLDLEEVTDEEAARLIEEERGLQ